MTTGRPGASAETTDHPDSASPALSGTARSLTARCAPRVNALARQMIRHKPAASHAGDLASVGGRAGRRPRPSGSLR